MVGILLLIDFCRKMQFFPLEFVVFFFPSLSPFPPFLFFFFLSFLSGKYTVSVKYTSSPEEFVLKRPLSPLVFKG